MIKPHELRIGNYVNYGIQGRNGLPTIKVTAIWPDLYWFDDTSHCSHLNENVIGIPVNEMVFEKCGISEYELGYYRLTDNTIINVDGYVYYENDDNSTDYLCECHFLHSLQNLYLALTGTELNITL